MPMPRPINCQCRRSAGVASARWEYQRKGTARTGEKVWDVRVADRAKGFSNSSGPLVVRGMVIQGLGGCDRFGPDRCYISAYDAASGKQLWRFNTVPYRGERP